VTAAERVRADCDAALAEAGKSAARAISAEAELCSAKEELAAVQGSLSVLDTRYQTERSAWERQARDKDGALERSAKALQAKDNEKTKLELECDSSRKQVESLTAQCQRLREEKSAAERALEDTDRDLKAAVQVSTRGQRPHSRECALNRAPPPLRCRALPSLSGISSPAPPLYRPLAGQEGRGEGLRRPDPPARGPGVRGRGAAGPAHRARRRSRRDPGGEQGRGRQGRGGLRAGAPGRQGEAPPPMPPRRPQPLWRPTGLAGKATTAPGAPSCRSSATASPRSLPRLAWMRPSPPGSSRRHRASCVRRRRGRSRGTRWQLTSSRESSATSRPRRAS